MADNPLEKAASGVSNGILWLIHFLSHTSDIAKQLSSLSGPVLAAITAVFYDVMKTALSAESAAAAAESGNVIGAVTLSETTLGLINSLVTDFKAGEATVVAGLKQLGIVKS